MKKLFLIFAILIIGSAGNQLHAQWQQTFGPFGWLSMYFAEGNGAVFAGYDKIYRSTNNGLSWTEKSNGISHSAVSAVFVSDTRVFAGLIENDLEFLYFSDDNGENWTQLNTVTNTAHITGFAKSGTKLFFTTYETTQNGVFLSTDNGFNWSRQANAGLPSTVARCIVSLGSYLFLGTAHGVFRSSDDGNSWQLCSIPDDHYDVTSLAVHSNTLYVVYGMGTGNIAVYKSNDYGLSFVGIAGSWLTFVNYVFAEGNNVYLNTYDGVYRSTNEGTDWSRIALTGAITYGTVVSGGNIIVGAYLIGIFTSTNNGVNWINTGYEKHVIVNTLASLGNILIAGSHNQHGLLISRDNGNSFTQYENLSGTDANCLAVRGDDFFAGVENSQTGGIFKSSDLGQTWSSIGVPNKSIHSIAFKSSYVFAGSQYDGVFRTSNDGATWNQLNIGLLDLWIKSLAVIDTMVYAGTSSGVFASSNNGSTWDLVGLQNVSINAMTIIDSKLFVGTGTGVYSLQPSGSWLQIGFPFTEILCLKSLNSALFAGTYSGLSMSTNFGNSWISINNGLTGAPDDLVFNQSYAFTGTSGEGVWRRPLSEITDANEPQNNFPVSYSLEQNYPNPFNPSTVISYQVVSAGRVSLKVFDLLGKETAELINEVKSPGTYSITFNAGNIPSGVYFYRLQAGNFVQTKKLVLLR